MLRTFLLLILTAFISAAIFTPWIYSLILIIDPDTRWPFSRVFGRVAQVAAAVFIIVKRREFKLAALKEHFNRSHIGTKFFSLVAGFILVSFSIAIVVPLLVQEGILQWSIEFKETVASKLLNILLSALVVSILEESFFRLLIFSNLKTKLSVSMAAIATSLLYAAVHFIAPVRSFTYSQLDPAAGFYYLGAVLDRYLQTGLYPAFLGLFIVGLILCYVMHRTGSLFLCIGLHMGWAAGLKFVKYFTTVSPSIVIPDSLGGRYFLVAQPIAWASMAVVFLLLLLFINLRYRVGSSPQQEKSLS